MTTTLIIVEVLGTVAMALLAIYLAVRMVGATKKKPTGAGAVGSERVNHFETPGRMNLASGC